MHLVARSILSLLMVWQLLASVLAHPLPEISNAHASRNHAMASNMAMSDCPHHHRQPMADAAVVGQSHTSHACHATCKCPCASTPALVLVLPGIPMTSSMQPLNDADFLSLPAAPVASLLRPPIA